MKHLKYIFAALLAVFFVGSARSGEHILPYTVRGGMMIVSLQVQSHAADFVLDTGGQTAVSSELAARLKLSAGESRNIVDAAGNSGRLQTAVLGALTTADGHSLLKDQSVMVMPAPNPFAFLGAEGVIGSDVLAQYVVQFDGRNARVVLHDADTPPQLNLRRMLPFAVPGVMPIVNSGVGPGYPLTVMFDTGYGSLLSLNSDAAGQFIDKQIIRVAGRGIGGASMTATGLNHADSLLRVNMERFSIGTLHFNNLTTEVKTNPLSLLGLPVLKYADITIDYPKSRLFIEPLRRENDMNTPLRDIDLMVSNGRLVVASVWNEAMEKVQPGDRVVAVNGENILNQTFDFDKSLREGIEMLNGEKVVLTIEHAGKAVTVAYR